MYKKQAKNLLLPNILKVLERHSDEDHKLSQTQILEFLKNDFNMVAERKSVARNIDNLIDEGYEILYEEKPRGKGRDKNVIRTNFYILRDFEDSELRLLIDGLLFSKYIPYSQCKKLIGKLEGLSNEYFKSRVKYIQLLKDDAKENEELFYSIDIIDEAIRKKKKISYNYLSYDINKKQVLRKDGDKVKKYIVSPYQMAAANGRYYLFCKHDNHDNLANVRVDRIKNIELLNDTIDECKESINLPKHMMEHLYMMGGESSTVKFEFDKKVLNDVIDWFGQDVFLREKGNLIEAQSRVNLKAMKYWAMQYGDYVKVTYPNALVSEIKDTLKDMQKKYK